MAISDTLKKINICLVVLSWVLVNVSDQAKTVRSCKWLLQIRQNFFNCFGPSYYSKILFLSSITHLISGGGKTRNGTGYPWSEFLLQDLTSYSRIHSNFRIKSYNLTLLFLLTLMNFIILRSFFVIFMVYLYVFFWKTNGKTIIYMKNVQQT